MNVTFKSEPVIVGDSILNIGDSAPEVNLVTSSLESIKVGGKQEKVQIIISVPSLDTPVCANEARKFNVEASKLQDVNVFIVSMDLPFASGRFCTTEGIDNLKVLSDFRNKDFSKKYGVLIKDSALEGLSARAVFIVDKSGKIAYKEIVSEITNEPNYNAIIEAVKKIV